MKFPQPNIQQIKQIIEFLLGTGGPVAALLVNDGVNASTINAIETIALAAVPPLVAFIWSMMEHTDHKVIAAAANTAGVSEIIVAPAANGGAAAAASNAELRNVTKADITKGP